ncbi:MAG: phosphoribosylanthranilate isomerase [Desulfovibrionaceae bacterium]|nr:phosphoribosylanthranilate isomerase [Desulfovibrionaceae bacterium]
MIIKICGITQEQDAKAAEALGASFCGFIFHPKSPRAIRPEVAASLDTGAMKRVGVFVDQDEQEILRCMRKANLDYAQLHGDQSQACARAIGRDRVIRVLWPERYGHKAELYRALQNYADSCAYYLFDVGTKGGGHGRTLDWDELCGLEAPHPWLIAGGLTPGNIVQALWESRPFGIDVNSGIEEAPGKKDHRKMTTLFHSVRTCYHSNGLTRAFQAKGGAQSRARCMR